MFKFRGRIRTVLALAAVAAVASLGVAQSASADPVNAKGSFPVTINCDNGHTYTAASNGNGGWTPAHDTASTTVLIPLAFHAQHVVVRDPNGNVVDEQTIPPSTKGAYDSSGRRGTRTDCTFSGGASGPEGSIEITGSVTAFATPAR